MYLAKLKPVKNLWTINWLCFIAILSTMKSYLKMEAPYSRLHIFLRRGYCYGTRRNKKNIILTCLIWLAESESAQTNHSLELRWRSEINPQVRKSCIESNYLCPPSLMEMESPPSACRMKHVKGVCERWMLTENEWRNYNFSWDVASLFAHLSGMMQAFSFVETKNTSYHGGSKLQISSTMFVTAFLTLKTSVFPHDVIYCWKA